MPIESASTIAQLDRSYPLGGDPTSQGDDHLRLLKQVLKDQFPGALGDGYDIPILATEVELNYSTGLTSETQEQLDALNQRIDDLAPEPPFPSGTRMTFNQPAPPINWTQDNTVDDSMMRVVSGIGGGIGGVDSPIIFSTSHTHTTGSVTLSVAQMPSHTHTVTSGQAIAGALSAGGFENEAQSTSVTTNPTGGNGSHNHGETSTDGATFTPKYIDLIIGIRE